MVKITHATHWKKGGLGILPIKTLSLQNAIGCIAKYTASAVFIIALLLIIKIDGYGQSTGLGNGIFDIQKSIIATSRATLVEAEGFGTSSYRTEKLPNGNLKVRYTYDKPSVPNPLFITYAYSIEKLPSGDFAMDMDGAMPPLSLYNDTTNAVLSYAGDKVVIPNIPTRDSFLSDASGIFELKILETSHLLLSYQVSLSNRKMVKKGNISLNGKSYEVYVHTYDFVQKTIINNNQVLSTIEEKVIEWFIPNCGQVFQERIGTRTTNTYSRELTTDSSSRSTLLNIKH